jgi:CRISPR-associated endonuclease Cas1
MGRGKVVNLVLDSYGSFLGMDKGCIILRDKKGNTERYPLFESEIGEVDLKSGNLVSTGVLTALGLWDISVVLTTRNGRPIATLKNLLDDSHVKTRICQYEALKNGKGIEVSKQIVLAKIVGQDQILGKYGLLRHDLIKVKEIVCGIDTENLRYLRVKLLKIEGDYTKRYFGQIFQLFPEKIRPKNRSKFRAYDGTNNMFNLAYQLLFWKCYRAISKAHLETHLGFIHILMFRRPSLVCDFEEIYRYLVDDFLIGYSKNLKLKDFIAKREAYRDKSGKRIYLNKPKTDEMIKELHDYFRHKVSVRPIKRGNVQEIESLINEEAFLLAKYLRGEREAWVPRTAPLIETSPV